MFLRNLIEAFSRNRRVQKRKMPETSTCIDSAIEKLDRLLSWTNGSPSRVKGYKLLGELEFLRTFLTYIPKWADVDEGVYQRLGGLLTNIEATFAPAGLAITDAAKQGDKSLETLCKKFLKEVESFKPKIREAYENLSDYSLQQSHSPITDCHLFEQFVQSIQGNLQNLTFEDILPAPLMTQIKTLREKLRRLGYLVSTFTSCSEFTDLWTYIESVALRAARLSYLCWIEKNNKERAEDIAIMFSLLQQKIKSDTPEVTEMFLRALIVVNRRKAHPKDYLLRKYVEFLLPPEVPVESLREGLVILIQFLFNLGDECTGKSKYFSAEVKTVIVAAASINYSSGSIRRGNDLLLFQLLQRIEILKVEAILMDLLKGGSELPLESLQKGQRALQAFLKHPLEKNADKRKLILTSLEAVIADVGTLYHSFQFNKNAEDMERNVLKLLVNIKLLKAEVVLIELIDCNSSFKDEIETLQEKLEFLRKFLSSPSEENSLQVKLISVIVQGMAREVVSLELSFRASQVTEDKIKGMNASFSSLLEKMKFVKLGGAYNNFPDHSLQSHSPVIDFDLWEVLVKSVEENLRLLTYEVDMTIPLKEQIEDLREKLKSLRYFIHHATNLNRNPLQSIDLWAHLRSVADCVSFLPHIRAVHKIDESMAEDLTVVIFDMQQMINANSPKVFEIYHSVLRFLATKHGTHFFLAGLFVRFLLPMNVAIEPLREGLILLIVVLISTPEEHAEDVKLISADIKNVIWEAGSINHLLAKQQDTDPALFQLLEKIELLKAEAFVRELLRNGAEGVANLPFRAIEEGLKVLQVFLRYPSEQVKLILAHFQIVVSDIGSLYRSIHAHENKEDFARGLLKLLVNIQLLKAVTLLMELAHGKACYKDEIETLPHWLEFLRNFLSGPSKENSQDEKLILTRMEGVAREAISLYHSFDTSQVTEVMAKELNAPLSSFLKKIQLVKTEAEDICFQVRKLSLLNFPKTNGLGFIDFFLQNLKQLLNYKADSIWFVKHQIEVIQGELESLRYFLRETARISNDHHEVKNLAMTIIDMAYGADYAIDSIVLKNGDARYNMTYLSYVVENLKVLKEQVKKIKVENEYAIELPNAESSGHIRPQAIIQRSGVVMVDLKDQADTIIDRLTRATSRRDIVSILGMPGLGKTTLAKNIFDNPSVKKAFHIRAWCYVSERYQKRNLLLKILSNISELTDEIHNKSDDDLAHLLYQRLKGNRYLVVMDDIWEIQAWHDLESSFPDDGNASRILFTSRDDKVALAAKSYPHPLRLLHNEESWKLLKEMLFQKEDCPKELVEVGKSIAQSCQGLPLAVVAMAGLLDKTDKKQEAWRKILENLSSLLLDDPQTRCREILEMSYNQLPDGLKSCFLYFGEFLDNKGIPVWKIKWLWVAEGFIPEIKLKTLEEVADDYLMELISRSLVSVAERRSRGGVKSCRIHDLLRNLCLSKAKEENFFQAITGYDKLFPSSDLLDYGVDSEVHGPSKSITHDQHRISISSKRNHFVMLKPSGPRVRSLLFFPISDRNPGCPYDVSFISDNFKLLRVLNLEGINMGSSLPTGIILLLQLRYLAVCGFIDCIPPSIAELSYLETFLVKGLKGKVAIPDAIWSMEKLRHLHVNNVASFQLQDRKLKHTSLFCNLVTLSSPSLKYGEDTMNILKRLPGLRKLRCIFSESLDPSGKCNQFPILELLSQLESLKIFYNGTVRQSCKFNFPKNLKKLTLSDFHLPWDCISVIGRLPNLEVLKLLSRAFDGNRWEMREGEFCKLKFLKLDSLDIVQWSASEDDLPHLEQLILRSCKKLVEIPSILGELSTLKMIGVQWCNSTVEKLVTEIEEEQKDLSNIELKVLINLPDADFRSSA